MAKPDAIANALKNAQAIAAENEQAKTTDAPATGGAVVEQPRTTTALATGGGQRRSLADLAASASMSVDFYFGVDDLGIKIGKDKSRRDFVDVTLRFKDIKGGWIIRGNSPAGVKYFQTYDGAIESKSRKPWEQVVAQVEQMDGNAYISDLIELPVTLVEGISDFKDKALKPIKAGTRGGVSISYMNYKHFCTWFAEQMDRFGEDATLRVRIGFQAKTGGGNSEYGVYTWQNLDDPEDQPAAAAA